MSKQKSVCLFVTVLCLFAVLTSPLVEAGLGGGLASMLGGSKGSNFGKLIAASVMAKMISDKQSKGSEGQTQAIPVMVPMPMYGNQGAYGGMGAFQGGGYGGYGGYGGGYGGAGGWMG